MTRSIQFASQVLSLTTLCTGLFLAGCEPPEPGEEAGEGGGGVGGFATGGGQTAPDTGGSATGGFGMGGAETGGASTGGVAGGCDTVSPPQAYQCAGVVGEQQVLGFNWATLSPQPYWYSCGYTEYPYPEYPEYPGTGGTGPYPEEPGAGGAAVLYPDDQATGGIAGCLPPPDAGMGGAGAPEGEGACGGGGWVSTGGASAGGSAGGSGMGGSPSSWCDGLEQGGARAGVSYAVGECTETQLRTPIHFQEPEGWYTLRVYLGSSPCDRGLLVSETAGYGVGGAEVEIPVAVEGTQFVSIELDTENDWGASGAVELLPLGE